MQLIDIQSDIERMPQSDSHLHDTTATIVDKQKFIYYNQLLRKRRK